MWSCGKVFLKYILGQGTAKRDHTEPKIEKLVSRIESLDGIVRSLGKVLGSDEPDASQTANKTTTALQDGEVQSLAQAGDNNNSKPWKIKRNSKTKISPLSQIIKVTPDGLLFNPLKSRLLCYNVDNPDTVYVTLGNTTVRTSLHEKHIGNFISNNIHDRHIKEYVCRLIGKTNAILCDFGCCDSSTLVNIHITFCMDLYGCELGNISSKYTEEMHTA